MPDHFEVERVTSSIGAETQGGAGLSHQAELGDAAPMNPAAEPRGQARIVGLDGLRGIAAIGVVLYHYTTCYAAFHSFNGPAPFTFQYGMYGVQLFFLISGFVVFMTVERKRRPAEFVKSRFIRLYPAHWLALLICVLLLVATPGPAPFMGWSRLARRAVANASMIQAWFHIGPINNVTWTLAIEMTFYVVILILLYLKKLDWTVPALCALVVVGAIDGYCNNRWPNAVSPWLRSLLALDYIHYILIGVLIYKMRLTPRPIYAVIAFLCLFAPYTQDPAFHEPGKEAIVGAVLVLIVVLATNGWISPLRWRGFVFLGAISYSLYLNHVILGYRVIFNGLRYGLSPLVCVLLAVAALILLATAITYLFELPVMAALRRRLDAKPKQSEAALVAGHPAVSTVG